MFLTHMSINGPTEEKNGVAGGVKRNRHAPHVTVPLMERAALNPREFAAVFGKKEAWGYNQIYKGVVRPITVFGDMMIPIEQIKDLLLKAEVYNGKGVA